MERSFDLEEMIWVEEKDIAVVTDNVRRHGILEDKWEEDPEETGDPYTRCEQYRFRDMKVEMMYINGDEYPVDIRASIIVGHLIDGEATYTVPEEDLRPTLKNHMESVDPSSPFLRKKYLELLHRFPVPV
jgi:hypothetical protein